MREMLRLPSATLCCALILGACNDATAPDIERNALANAAAAKESSQKRKADVHAIHVRITSMVFNATTIDLYSFKAMEHHNGVKGHFFFYQIRLIDGEEQAVVIASGPMECLRVTGNKARVGGRVDFTTFPEGIPMGSEITWSVTDNGKSANADDSASQPLGNDARAYCELGLPYPEHPVEFGKIQIKP